MKREQRHTSRKLVLTFVAAMAGGVLPSSCITRFGDAVATGSRSFVFSLLDPTLFIQNFLNGDEE